MDNGLKISIPVMVSVIVVSLLISTLASWVAMNKTFMDTSLNVMSVNQLNINENLLNKKFPVIKGDNIRVKINKAFNIKEYVFASDEHDGNISNKLEFYGTVNTKSKGVYVMRCVARNSYGLKTVKNIQVIVD